MATGGREFVSLRIATFNAENLFARYKFKSNIDPVKAVVDGWRADMRYFDIYDEPEKKLTGSAIRATGADVIALQEVENLDTLKRFRDTPEYRVGGRKAYPYALVIDGNDPRLIDVAVLSRYPLKNIRTHQYLRDPSSRSYVFSRDCLELDVELNGSSSLTLYVNHLKSMFDKKDPCHGRRRTRERREGQARAVKDIVIQRFGEKAGEHPFVVLGDLNDYLEDDDQGKTGIEELVRWEQVENIVERRPEDDRWTHFFKGNRRCGIPQAYRQLDYILLSRALADTNRGLPLIERRGSPKRAEKYRGPRFPGVGWDAPKASDHCPVVMDLTV